MPSLIAFYDTYRKHRDKFEILAFHDATAKNFAELDPKLGPIQETAWKGRALPFPILMDSTGETIKRYGINSFPTLLLIDPEGRLVKRTRGYRDLAEKLPPLPPAEQVELLLEEVFALGIDRPMLLQEWPWQMWRLEPEVDQELVAKAGLRLPAQTDVNFSAAITLRSMLNLHLRPLGLTYKIDGKRLIFKPGKLPPESKGQKYTRLRIERKLRTLKPFPFKGTLKALQERLEEVMSEFVALRVPQEVEKAQIQLKDSAGTLGDALARALKPAGLHVFVGDDVLLIYKR